MIKLALLLQLTVLGQLADRVTAVEEAPNYPPEGWGGYRGPVVQMDGGWWRCTEDNDYWVDKPDVPERGWYQLHYINPAQVGYIFGGVFGNFRDRNQEFRRDDTCDVVATPPPPEQVPPERPTNAAATLATTTSLMLTWTDNSTTETRFRVQKRIFVQQPDSTILSTWGLIGWADANITQFLWAGLDPGTTYEFRIAACNEVGCSQGSNPGFGTTQMEPEPPVDTIPEPPVDTIPPSGGWSLADSIPQGRILAPGNFYWHVMLAGEPYSQHTTEHVAFSTALQVWQQAVIATGQPADVRVCTDVEMDGYCYQVVKGETVILP